jgi:hypothetical protein
VAAVCAKDRPGVRAASEEAQVSNAERRFMGVIVEILFFQQSEEKLFASYAEMQGLLHLDHPARRTTP